MGCTSSKATRHPLNQQEQIIPEHFRQWIETNRPEADELLLKQIRTNQLNDLQSQEDYQTISRKIIDLLIQRPDIKTTQKLTKTLQKELPTIPLKTIEQTVEHLEKTFQTTKDLTTTATTTNKIDENHVEQILPGSPGKALKDALETARILFYKVNVVVFLSLLIVRLSLLRVNKLRSLLIHMVVMTFELLTKTTKIKKIFYDQLSLPKLSYVQNLQLNRRYFLNTKIH